MQYSYDNYFSISDILSALSWLIILTIIVLYKSSTLQSKRLSKLYILNFFFKITFATVFALYYILVVNGGDTLGYWEGSKCIQNIFVESPLKGIEHIFSTPSRSNLNYFFSASTGYPPLSMYLEPETYFVSKIVAIVSAISLKSYMATTFIFAFLFSSASWKLFEIAQRTNLFNQNKASIALLFIPSVSFWCAGVSKDTIILISIFFTFAFLYELLSAKKLALTTILGLVCSVFIIYETRNFILITIIFPLFIVALIHFNKRFKLHKFIKVPLSVLLVGSILAYGINFLSTNQGEALIQNNGFIQEALIVQQDFKTNKAYGKNQYSLGKIDNSAIGIVKAIPISIFSGIFQPLPWNGLTISLILNAIESFILLSLIIYITLSGKIASIAKQIWSNEILLFILIFVILIAFMAGFTSIIYGVLVRIRAPLLPFFTLLFFIEPTLKKLDKNIKTKSLSLAKSNKKRFE